MQALDGFLPLLARHLAEPWWGHLVSYAPWMAVVALIERLWAARGHDAAASWLNLRYIVVSVAVSVLLVDLATAALRPLVLPLRPLLAPVRDALHGAPAWLQFLLSVVTIDFFYYWTHRAQHRLALLWRVHEVHHSDPSFNVTTTLRVHWIEEPIKAVMVLTPAALLVDVPSDVPTALLWLAAAWLFFIHANARISFGPFNRVLVSPAVHRVHHSVEPDHHDRNFAAFFAFWDLLFGTWKAPPKGRWPVVGTDCPPPASAWQAHLRPFTRRTAQNRSHGA